MFHETRMLLVETFSTESEQVEINVGPESMT